MEELMRSRSGPRYFRNESNKSFNYRKGRKSQELMPNLHFLLLFEGAYIDAQLLDSMPEATLIDAKDLCRLDLDAA